MNWINEMWQAYERGFSDSMNGQAKYYTGDFKACYRQGYKQGENARGKS